jgi:hypothetical protein
MLLFESGEHKAHTSEYRKHDSDGLERLCKRVDDLAFGLVAELLCECRRGAGVSLAVCEFRACFGRGNSGKELGEADVEDCTGDGDVEKRACAAKDSP